MDKLPILVNTLGEFLEVFKACPSNRVLRLREERRHRLAHHLRDAHFPVRKTLETFDFAIRPTVPRLNVWQMATGDWIAARENCLILGSSGVGKSHLGIALGVAALDTDHRVRVTTAMALSQELMAAQAEPHLVARFKAWHRYDLVIGDELGYLPWERAQANSSFNSSPNGMSGGLSS